MMRSGKQPQGSLRSWGSWAAERTAEWKKLLDPGDALQARGGAPDWAKENAKRILPCAPASGEALGQLLGQLGLELR